MNERRQKAVFSLFNSMDVNKDGKITIVDLKV
jgi:Ca2+-binding EF-hand superfamily protein